MRALVFECESSTFLQKDKNVVSTHFLSEKTFLAKNSQAIGRLLNSSVLKPGSIIFSGGCFIKVLLMMHEEERLANTLTPEIY